jgi:hypothetical protein
MFCQDSHPAPGEERREGEGDGEAAEEVHVEGEAGLGRGEARRPGQRQLVQGDEAAGSAGDELEQEDAGQHHHLARVVPRQALFYTNVIIHLSIPVKFDKRANRVKAAAGGSFNRPHQAS